MNYVSLQDMLNGETSAIQLFRERYSATTYRKAFNATIQHFTNRHNATIEDMEKFFRTYIAMS